jgi:hypothetical protein
MLASGERRWGWTRVEVIVLGLAGVLGLGLVVMLISGSRDPAQRTECKMHLKYLGDAIRIFHDTNNMLPASCIAPGYATWAVQIAPLLKKDQGKALAAWDAGLQLPYYEQTAAAREAQVWVYYCPARRGPPQLSVSDDSAPDGKWKAQHVAGALGDYACAPGTGDPARPWTSIAAEGALILGEVLEKQGDRIKRWKSLTTMKSLKRGQAYTILLGEKHVPKDAFGQTAQGDGSLYNGDHPASFARIIGKDHGLAQAPTDPFKINFGSWHPGICQFLFADGSVDARVNNVDPELLAKWVPRELPPGDAPK